MKKLVVYQVELGKILIILIVLRVILNKNIA